MSFTRNKQLGRQIDWAHPLSRGLRVAWLFNEGAGRRVNDTARRVNTATGGTGQTHGTFVADTAWGGSPFGRSLSFDGTGDRVTVASGYTNIFREPPDALPKHTILLWTNARSFANSPVLWDADSLGVTDFFGEFNTTNGWYWGYSGSFRTYTGAGLQTHRWYQNVFCKDAEGDNGRHYIDAKLQTAYTGTLGNLKGGASDLTIGDYAHNNGFTFNGLIDHFLIWGRALSAGEVAWLYEEPFAFLRRPASRRTFVAPAAGATTGAVRLAGQRFRLAGRGGLAG